MHGTYTPVPDRWKNFSPGTQCCPDRFARPVDRQRMAARYPERAGNRNELFRSRKSLFSISALRAVGRVRKNPEGVECLVSSLQVYAFRSETVLIEP
jgi:hypothetical protein